MISNALKFTNKNGKVKVELYEEVSDILVLVTDSGCGMDAKTGKHIFEKFYQGDTSHAGRGNGIGLALVKRIIDITGSEITVDSEVGKGSTFAVRLKKD